MEHAGEGDRPFEHAPGELVNERYRIVGTLGRGGTATTYSADDLERGRRVALKQLWLWHRNDWKVLELFEREARVLAGLNHPAIPKYFDFFQLETARGPCFYLAQELAEGRTLKAWVESGFHPPETLVRNLADELLGILEYLHGLSPPVIHRDIKPANLIWRTDGRIALVDFGAARDTLKSQTSEGSTIVGTYGFMAPEQFRGHAVPQTDLYGVGATCLWMLSRRTPAELPEKNGQPKVALATVSPALEAWIARLVLRAPEERFSSAALARQALRDPAPVSTRSSRRSRAVRLAAVIVASVAVVVAIALRDLWPKSPQALARGPAALPGQTARTASDVTHATGRIRWVRNFIGHWSAVFSVAVDPAGKNLVTTSNDGTAKLWDIDKGSPLRSFLGHKGRVGASVFTRDGERIITGSDTIRVFDVDTAALVKTLDGHTAEVASLAISPDGTRLASTAFDGTCRIWDLGPGTELRQIAEPTRCFGVAWSGDGDKIAVGCEDGSVYVANPTTGQKTSELRAHTSAIDAILFSPDGKTVVTSSDDHTIGVLGGAPLSVIRHLTGHEDEVWAIALATDGQTLVSGGKDGTLRLWNLYSGSQNDIYQTKLEPILKLVFLPDGKRFIAAHAGSAASLFTLREPSWQPPLVTAPMPRPPLEFAATDPQEKKLTLTAQRDIDDHSAGPFQHTRELLTRAIALNPKYAPAHVELARLEYRSGYRHHDEYDPASLERALSEAERAVALDPTLAEAYIARGYAQLFAKHLDDARASSAQATKLAPTQDRVVLLSLSLAEAAKNYDLQFDTARSLIETSKDPHTLSLAYAALIKPYEEREEWDAVESTYSSLFNIDPDSAWSKGNYAQYLSWRGKHDEAIEWARKALATFDYPAGRTILADAYAGKAVFLLDTDGFMDDAERLIDLAQKASADSAVAWYALGRLQRAKDNPIRARLAFETALHLKPDYPAAKAALAAL